MRSYVKPQIIMVGDLAEGVYASSGAANSGTNGGLRVIPCDVFEFRPGIWRYDIWFDNIQDVPASGMDLYLNFSVPVTLNWCDDQKGVSGEGTQTLKIHFNPEDVKDPSRDRGLEVKTDIRPELKNYYYQF